MFEFIKDFKDHDGLFIFESSNNSLLSRFLNELLLLRVIITFITSSIMCLIMILLGVIFFIPSIIVNISHLYKFIQKTFFKEKNFFSQFEKYSKDLTVKDSYILRKEHHDVRLTIKAHYTPRLFIKKFIHYFNNEYSTYSSLERYPEKICGVYRRRSLGDIYLITKYYFPKITVLETLQILCILMKTKEINGSYCRTINKFVFHNERNNYRGHNHPVEYCNDKNITFENVSEYIEKK